MNTPFSQLLKNFFPPYHTQTSHTLYLLYLILTLKFKYLSVLWGKRHLQVNLFLYSQSGSSTQSQLTSTGVGMLFSAGTFLYVATVHILPEVSSSKAVQMTSDLQQQEGAEAHQQQPLGFSLSITLIIGIGLPLVLALGLKDD